MTRILVVGSGAREHALVWKLRRDDPAAEIFATPGNAGIAETARCIDANAADVDALAGFAAREKIDLTVIGPEAALAAGVVDAFRARLLPVFGPTAAAARLETSKSFAKDVMNKAGVPTARARTFTDAAAAKRGARSFGVPVVIKACGLAAGKGVTVATSVEEADAAIDHLLSDRALGNAGEEILVEEFLEGEELSLFVVTNGVDATPMLPAQDHKRAGEGDTGPNTGGMGAYAPVSIATPAVIDATMRRVVEPTLAAMRELGTPFAGLLYVGLMLTGDGPKVVEFNARFGDPETEALLPLLSSSLLDALLAVAHGDAPRAFQWSDASAVTTVVAAHGYPERPRTGGPLRLEPAPDDVYVFHAGTARRGDELVSAGGRVLAITAVAPTLDAAAAKSRDYAPTVGLDGKQFRRDIGWRELRRQSR